MELGTRNIEDVALTLKVGVLTIDQIQDIWRDLNRRYFGEKLAPISIVWSRRLTASVGMFVSHVGPRAQLTGPEVHGSERRLIRLSVPLLRDQPDDELIGTLAHEMIHQWQYDRLKRRPDHGPEFHRMMAVMNRDGLGITIRHSLEKAVHALTKYTWRCTDCGRDYHRQRKTIRPGRHRCGQCLGKLRELPHASMGTRIAPPKDLAPTILPAAPSGAIGPREPFMQIPLPFANH